MLHVNFASYKRRTQGQTLIIAILVLGLLLILGTVFASIIGRNVNDSGRARNRTLASDLAESGVRYAHYQLLHSSSGADWRPQYVPPTMSAVDFSRDPDALYMRPASAFAFPGFSHADKGGPDGYGPFTRVEFDKGRSLVRVRYAPSNTVGTSSTAGSGSIRQPGKVKNMLVIESVGRSGKVRASDPTTMLKGQVQVSNYASQAALASALSTMKQLDPTLSQMRKIVAVAQIGLTDYSRYITNIFNVSTPAEFGSPVAGSGGDSSGLGVEYGDSITAGNFAAQPVTVETVLGGTISDSADVRRYNGGGSLFSNASLMLFGRTVFNLDPVNGDGVKVAGSIKPANSASAVDLILPDGARTGTSTVTLTGNQLDSGSGAFSTIAGAFRDGVPDADAAGSARSIGRIEPPSILDVDPVSGVNRYLPLTRDSGIIASGRNTGRFGFGQGIYIDCTERENIPTESDREKTGAARSIVQDWLNPNQDTGSGWEGPYYRPVAPLVLMNPEGFSITRDSKSTRRFWRTPTGGPTTRATLNYRILNGWILDDLTFPSLSTATFADFQAQGRPFNGVLYFEGDCRVRGVIPTDVQVTLVSMGSIYIDGSITKGVVDNTGATLNRPSRSMCALLAKDYVAVNTTAFFGPEAAQAVAVKRGDATQVVPRSIELDAANNGEVNLRAQFLLNNITDAVTAANAGNPTSWRPLATSYTDAVSTARINPSMIMQQSADNNGPAFINLAVSSLVYRAVSSGPVAYLFESGTLPSGDVVNAAVRTFFTPNDGSLIRVPVYGLADGSTNIYPKFESNSYPLIDNTFTFANRQLNGGASVLGSYQLALQDETLFHVNTTQVGPTAGQNYLLSKFAVTPYDVRIEALCYAQEGSFFIIPGPAFNTNPNDSREAFTFALNNLGTLAAAQADRLQRTGNAPEVPFYNEPQNVRVQVIGSISENMPAPMSVQVAWQRLWGWMPRYIGGTGNIIPRQHAQGRNMSTNLWVPNFSLTYDPALAMASADGTNAIRTSADGLWTLPPLPKLPVSPTLAYFGEVNP